MLRTFIINFCALLILTPAFSQVNSGILNTKVEISYEVKKVEGVNTVYSEFSPVIAGNRLVFISDRDFDYLNWGENRWKKNKFLNVFSSEITVFANDSFNLGKPVIHLDQLKHLNHTGPVTFSSSGDEIIFTQVNKEKNKVNKPQLFSLSSENGKWLEKQKLNFNNEEYSFAQPSISSDGKYLFFTSDMPGGFGGKDIWYCERTNEGWGTPKNAGTKVNTSGDEMFPYYANNLLYFSSNGPGTTGKLDIFKSTFKEGEFSQSENLGPTINSPEDDFGFSLTKDFKSGFFSSSREGGKGSDDIYFFKVIEKVTVESRDLAGKFTYRTLNSGNVNGLEVLLLDDSGRVVMRTRTNQDGEFVFKSLPLDEKYTIKIISDNPDMNLEIINRDGEAIAILVSDKTGAFIYKKLDPSMTGSLSMMETEDTPLGKRGVINGQFIYEKLPGSYPEGLNIFLVDDAGNIVKKTKTDSQGNFSFRELPLDQNLMLRTDATTDDVTLLIYDKSDNIIAEMRKNEDGDFVFRKLNSDIIGNIAMIDNNSDPSLVAPKSTSLSGKFKYRVLTGETGIINFVVVDDSGKIIGKGSTDEKGNFRIKNLPPSDHYIIEIVSNDPDLNRKYIMEIRNRSGKTVTEIENDAKGRFIYRLLETLDMPATMLSEDEMAFIARIPNIYFEKSKSDLSAEAKKTLDRLAQLMKKHPSLKLEISGYADARYTDTYNLQLSRQRMESARNYLISKDVSGSRIKGNFYGESKLVNSCTDDAECSDEEHGKNRRCEFKVIR